MKHYCVTWFDSYIKSLDHHEKKMKKKMEKKKMKKKRPNKPKTDSIGHHVTHTNEKSIAWKGVAIFELGDVSRDNL